MFRQRNKTFLAGLNLTPVSPRKGFGRVIAKVMTTNRNTAMSSKKTQMKLNISTLALLAGLLTAESGQLLAQTPGQLGIHTAIEVEYQTELGKSYNLQGSLDLNTWVNIGNSVLGNGQVVNQVFSKKDSSSVSYASYRLLIAPGPTNGYAPWSIGGVSLQMDDSSSSNVVQYLTSTNGQDAYATGNDPFTYGYSRLSANDAHAERTYTPDRHDTIDYSFTAPNSGSWVREEFEHGVLKNRKIGAFHYVGYSANNGGTNPPPVITPTAPPAPPSSMTGLVYYAFTGQSPDKYQFNMNNSGTATPGTSSGEVETTSAGNIFTYTYSVLSSNTASLVINFGYYGIGGDRQEYDLQFNDGPSALFNRRIYRLGSLFTTDQGVFTPNAVLAPPPATANTNGTPNVTNAPPSSPVGYTYTMNYSTNTSRAVYQTATGGTQFDESAPSTFTYTYASTGTNTFHTVLTFKPDKWNDYVLTFANGAGGSLVIKRYDKNLLKRTDSGSFTIRTTNP